MADIYVTCRRVKTNDVGVDPCIVLGLFQRRENAEHHISELVLEAYEEDRDHTQYFIQEWDTSDYHFEQNTFASPQAALAGKTRIGLRLIEGNEPK